MILPPTAHHHLDNGVELVTVSWAGTAFTEVRIVLPLARYGPRDAAMAALLGRVLLLGPDDVGQHGLAERLLERSMTLTCQVGTDRLTISAVVPAGEERLVRDVLARLTRLQAGPEALTAQVRSEAEVAQLRRAHRESALRAELLERRWGDGHPYTFESADPATLADVTLDDLYRFADGRLSSNGAAVVVVGDFESADGAARRQDLRMALEEWSLPGTSPALERATSPARPGRADVALNGQGLASVRLWVPAPPRQLPGHAALHLWAVCLGGYFDSRLVQELRERRGDVYSVTAGFEVLRSDATLVLGLDCPAHRLDSVLQAIDETIDQLLAPGPTGEELRAAARYSASAVTVGMSTPAALASAGATVLFGGDDLSLWRRQSAEAERLTAPEVAREARQALAPENRVMVIGRPG